MTRERLLLGASLLATALIAPAADLYWDADTSAPLVGSGTALNLSGSYFSTNAAGSGSLTTIGNFDNLFFQTDVIRGYTCSIDIATNVISATVGNSNDVVWTTVPSTQITITNAITIENGSSLTFHHLSNARVIYGSNNDNTPALVLGAGDNTFTIKGTGSSTAYWIQGLFGDAGDRAGVTNGSHWTVNRGVSTFGGELFGPWRFSAGALTLTGDSPDFTGSLEGGTVILGDGGTSGSIGSGRRTYLGVLRFNRSDDYVFTNEMHCGTDATFDNIGTGSVTLVSPTALAAGGALILNGPRMKLCGNASARHRIVRSGTGVWTLAGSSYSAGLLGGAYSTALTLSGGGSLRLGDGTTNTTLIITNNASLSSGTSLIMDLTGGAYFNVTSNLNAGAGTDLVIVGGGQEDPIITYGNVLTPFENVVYAGRTNTWAAAQVPGALYGLGGKTQLRIDGNDIYIDPLPPRGTILVIR